MPDGNKQMRILSANKGKRRRFFLKLTQNMTVTLLFKKTLPFFPPSFAPPSRVRRCAASPAVKDVVVAFCQKKGCFRGALLSYPEKTMPGAKEGGKERKSFF